jgi:inner membrane protein
MDAITGFLEGLTVWHWAGIGIVLLTLEVAVGTFDLLWVSMAAFLTALFGLIIPAPFGAWQGQLIFFAIVAVAFLVAGRTWFKGLRRAPSSHPNLNDRLAGMIGKHGEAATSFDGGEGKVKVGDTVWLARQADETVIVEGDQIVVSGAEGTTLKVRLV